MAGQHLGKKSGKKTHLLRVQALLLRWHFDKPFDHLLELDDTLRLFRIEKDVLLMTLHLEEQLHRYCGSLKSK